MDYKHIAIFGSLIFIALVFGCIGPSETFANETKLEVTEGVGIVGSLKVDALNPGLDGYVILTVRNNLGGETARDVTIALDNVNPFEIFDCGKNQTPDAIRTCAGLFDLDNTVPYRSHKTSRLAPGEEVDVFWRVRAPSADAISNIAVRHPIYYDVSYTYRTDFNQNLVFMSQQEQLRRRQSGEDVLISGSSGMSAGELRMSGTTQQPIIYFFNEPFGASENVGFSFPLQFSVENQGTGIPISDVVVLFEHPASIKPDEADLGTFGWVKWNDLSSTCTTEDSQIDCRTWIESTFGDDLNNIAQDRLLVKVVKREDFVQSFNMFIPLELTNTELTTLKNSNIPLKIYTFRLFNMYSYFFEGKDYITVYPIRVTG